MSRTAETDEEQIQAATDVHSCSVIGANEAEFDIRNPGRTPVPATRRERGGRRSRRGRRSVVQMKGDSRAPQREA